MRPGYDSDISIGKVRRTLTLDPEVVESLGADEAALSRTANEILREEIERRSQATALLGLLARLAAERGPVDPVEVEEFDRLLA